MLIVDSLGNLDPRPRCLALGNFDGVHLGHNHLLKCMAQGAHEAGISASALTFEPHPSHVLTPLSPAKLLSLPRERSRLIADIGIDELIVLPFDLEFSRISAQTFVQEIIIKGCQARIVYVGNGYRFGYGGKGDEKLLASLLQEAGSALKAIDLIPGKDSEGNPITSTAIRNALLKGDLEQALQMLGHEFILSGNVQRGDGLATSLLGYPTANLDISPYALLPCYGVYIAKASFRDDNFNTYCSNALVYIGNRPSVGGVELRVEAHLLGFCGDLYGCEMHLSLTRFLRAEMQFATLAELSRQIAKDIATIDVNTTRE